MKLKIACKNPNQCSFECLNCPFSDLNKNPNWLSKNIVDKTFNFYKVYKEINQNEKIKLRNCHQCKNKVSSTRTLLKLKDGYWYCLTCIMYYKKKLFSQLKINGYWYNILQPFLYSKYSENVNYKPTKDLIKRK